MASGVTSRRVPWIALALSFLSAGVGHLYCGRIVKGLPLYFAWLLVPLCDIVAATKQRSTLSLGLLLLLPVLVVLIVYFYAAIDAWRLARKAGSDYVLRDYNRGRIYWLLIAGQLVFSMGLIIGVRSFVYESFLIPTKSMSPTILPGDIILARKLPLIDAPERGDLIVYRNPMPTGASRFMGRVLAVGGDKVKQKGTRIFINGDVIDRDRVPDASLKFLGKHVSGQIAYEKNSGRRYLVAYDDESPGDFEATVPEHQIFVLGDNRDRSNDSRNFGPIHTGDIVGYVDYIFWPSESWSRFGVVDK